MTSPTSSSPASAFVITPTLQPVTVTLTHELLYDLQDVAIKAVARNDLPSLAALKAAGVDLDSALTYSVRNGQHATTRGLREMGVKVTAIIVDWAVAKSPESYFSLCDGSELVFPNVALASAVEAGKFNFAMSLIDQHGVPVTDRVIDRIFTAKHAVPAQVLEKLFAALPDRPASETVQRRAAQYGTAAIMDRVLQLTKAADRAWLAAIALKANNVAVVRELLATPIVFPPSVIARYVEDTSYLKNHSHDECNAIDASFMMTLAQCGAQFTLSEVQPLVNHFLKRKAIRMGIRAWEGYDKALEREYVKWLTGVLTPSDRELLADRMAQSAVDHFTGRFTQNDRLQFVAQARDLVQQSAVADLNIEGPQL